MKVKLWALLLLPLFFDTTFTFECSTIDNCLCLTEPEIELQCPEEDEDFIIHIKEDNEILIDCKPELENLKISHLPNVTIANISNFRMRFCPLLHTPFKTILDRFSLLEIASLEFSFSYSKNVTVTADHFQGLGNLVELKMNENSIMNLGANVFKNTPNLQRLQLQDNNLQLEPDLFESVQELTFLDLSGNRLTELQPNSFQSLTKLQILHLWDNKLTNLNEFTFRGLVNLQSLELSSNKIGNISENTFQQLKNLKRINLSANSIRKVPKNLFRFNRNLKTVRMRYNLHLKLPDYLFANLSLVEVDLANCHLSTLPEHVFENTSTLKVLKLDNNYIKWLPNSLFRDLINLEQIHLQNNSIESVSHVFDGLYRLKSLYLQDNLISELDEKVFADLSKLEKVNLKGNRIAKIDNQLSYNKNIKVINLSHNNILESTVNVSGAKNLHQLDLSHNNITVLKLKNLKMSSEVLIKFDYNKISVVDFQDVDLNLTRFTISMSNNPISCDCHNYDLVNFLKNKKKNGGLSISVKKLKCAKPSELRDASVNSLSLALTCPMEDTVCPEKCSCNWRPLDTSRIINCSGQNLTEFPRFSTHQTNFQFNQTEVHLEDNNLGNGPENLPEYGNVTKLYLSNNTIQGITWLPPNLEVLRVDNNRLRSLDFEIVQKLYSLKSVDLDNNSWTCDCGSAFLADFLLQANNSISSANLYCQNFNSRLIDLKRKDLCYNFLALYMLLIVLIVLLTLAILSILYYRHEQKIKIWLFAKKLCLWLISEEKLDTDKIYDAFISYSHKDEDFVAQKLVPVLESGPQPYKLCLHYRNWIPGEFVTTQITNSVIQSRRTLVVLSENFLESVWGKMEFRTAHTQALSEGRARVVIILYGDVNVSGLDEELKIYLETNTYVKWGDPYFWKKLTCALPKRKGGSKGQKIKTKVKLMDDESRLIQSNPSSPGSTPPVSTTEVNPLTAVSQPRI